MEAGREAGKEAGREKGRGGREGGARAKPGNQLVYCIKLHCPFVCLSVPPPPFRHDCRTATKFGTHIRVDMGLILS